AEGVVVGERELEEAEAVVAGTARFHCVRVTGEAGDHRDVRVDGVADGHALSLERLVVVGDPVSGLGRVDERERQRADPELCGQVNRLAIRTGHPDRRGAVLPRGAPRAGSPPTKGYSRATPARGRHPPAWASPPPAPP